MAYKDIFRDETRDRVCEILQDMGINAKMSERGRPEESVGLRPYFKSLGMIEIAEGPIRWVNVIRKKIAHKTEYFLNYGVPDPRLDSASPKVLFKSEPERKLIIFGKISDLTWEGEDSGTGIIDRIKSDGSLKETIIKSKVVFTITAYGKGGYWIISSSYSELLVSPTHFPSEQEWSSCQMIAHHLLAD